MAPPRDLDRLLSVAQFPGLPAAESQLFRAWLTRHGSVYDEFEFNVRLGDGVPPLAHWPEWLKKLASDTSRLRADVIGWQGNNATIIEVERRAGPIAIGQLLNYRSLLFRARPATRAVSLLLVAEQVTPDMRPALEDNGIGLELIAVMRAPAEEPRT